MCSKFKLVQCKSNIYSYKIIKKTYCLKTKILYQNHYFKYEIIASRYLLILQKSFNTINKSRFNVEAKLL